MDREFLIDLFAAFGPVTIRRMFSGFGVSVDGVNFALALREAIYLRVDPQDADRFAQEGSAPFQYQTKARTVTVASYWRLPERLYDDPDELADWSRIALAAAQRAALAKPRRVRAAKPGQAGESGRQAAQALGFFEDSGRGTDGSGDLGLVVDDRVRIGLADHPVAAVALGGVEAGVGAFDQRVGDRRPASASRRRPRW